MPLSSKICSSILIMSTFSHAHKTPWHQRELKLMAEWWRRASWVWHALNLPVKQLGHCSVSITVDGQLFILLQGTITFVLITFGIIFFQVSVWVTEREHVSFRYRTDLSRIVLTEMCHKQSADAPRAPDLLWASPSFCRFVQRKDEIVVRRCF